MHLLYYADSKREVDLSGVHSVEELIAACRTALADGQLAANGWLIGRAWNQNGWDVPRIPDRYDLDRISTEVPIALSRACYHLSLIHI